MTTAALTLIVVHDVPCSWCGYAKGHDPRCYVGQLPMREPAPRPSRELFAAAQREGSTVGHEWARSTAQHPAL